MKKVILILFFVLNISYLFAEAPSGLNSILREDTQARADIAVHEGRLDNVDISSQVWSSESASSKSRLTNLETTSTAIHLDLEQLIGTASEHETRLDDADISSVTQNTRIGNLESTVATSTIAFNIIFSSVAEVNDFIEFMFPSTFTLTSCRAYSSSIGKPSGSNLTFLVTDESNNYILNGSPSIADGQDRGDVVVSTTTIPMSQRIRISITAVGSTYAGYNVGLYFKGWKNTAGGN